MNHLEGRVYVRTGRGGKRHYYYRRSVVIFENGISKREDVRRKLGSNLQRAMLEAARLDARVESMARGQRPSWVETLGQLVEWYSKHITETRKLLGARTMISNVRIFLERVGDVRLEVVTPNTVEAFLSRRRQERSGATVVGNLRDVRRMFAVAVEEGLMHTNPAARVKPPKASRMEPRLPTAEEVKRLLDYLKTHKVWLYRIVMTMLCTGCRLGEALTLTWDRVDFTTGIITLLRRKVQDEHRLPIAAQLKEVLWAHWTEQGMPKEGNLFQSQAGKVYTPGRALFALKPVARRLGMEWMTLKVFRKLAATTAVESTGSVRVAQMLLGHTSARTTEMYLGRGFEARTEGVKAMEGFLDSLEGKAKTEKPGVQLEGGKLGTKDGTRG